eukprot:TRINITY_DN10070_c0_g1_i1.p1 TRINITY_DN10070_c0_g1~~TRINITY_DN10070_c0_g1_i1.p1  ORF type:complete len:217 (+),score=41.70 TRINITY_DN10070_c0_g1_i1:174-824(+)
MACSLSEDVSAVSRSEPLTQKRVAFLLDEKSVEMPQDGFMSPAKASTRAPASPLESLQLGSESDSEEAAEIEVLCKEADHDGLAIIYHGDVQLRIPLLATEAMPAAARREADPCLTDDWSDSFFSGRKCVRTAPDAFGSENMLALASPVKSSPKRRRLVVTSSQKTSGVEQGAVSVSGRETTSLGLAMPLAPERGSSPALHTPPKRRRVILKGSDN